MLVYYIISSLLVLLTILPLLKNQHWIFRLGDFAKVHVMIGALLTFSLGIAVLQNPFSYSQIILLLLFLYHASTIIKFTPIYIIDKKTKSKNSSQNISILSANIYQFNKDYDRFQKLIQKYKPNIFITLESNSDWEHANRLLEKEYSFTHKVTLENTYGMHIYSKIPFNEVKEHYFVADDIPCIETQFKLKEGHQFAVFAVHPPPPSPTEEQNSKERDGELMSVAKRLLEVNKPSIVIGDLNNVAWARSSVLFKKKGNLIDPRIGRGLISTFHAKYWFLRMPIDHLFHTKEIFVENIKALEAFGSDHFPIWAEFWIDAANLIQDKEIESTTHEDEKVIKEMIIDGVQEQSDRSQIV